MLFPPGSRVPDFVIAGAMKCGTTTLHNLLNLHPDAFVAEGEVFHFDQDDWEEHPIGYRTNGREWIVPRYDPHSAEQQQRYLARFTSAPEGALLGEDSTTYIASDKGAERIAEALPDAKIIVLLRDPASRAYSHYWHLVRRGWTGDSLNGLLRKHPGMLLKRSCYLPQMERVYRHFPREQVLVLKFEEFVADMPAQLGEVTRFLGLTPIDSIDSDASHSNRGSAPVMLGPHLFFNRLFWSVPGKEFVTGSLGERRAPASQVIAFCDKVRRKLNPLVRRIPKMDDALRYALDSHFSTVNQGLDELVGRPISDGWYRALPKPH